MLEAFNEKVEKIAEGYADLVQQRINEAKQPEDLEQINEGIRLLNHIAGTLERISRVRNGIRHTAEREN